MSQVCPQAPRGPNVHLIWCRSRGHGRDHLGPFLRSVQERRVWVFVIEKASRCEHRTGATARRVIRADWQTQCEAVDVDDKVMHVRVVRCWRILTTVSLVTSIRAITISVAHRTARDTAASVALELRTNIADCNIIAKQLTTSTLFFLVIRAFLPRDPMLARYMPSVCPSVTSRYSTKTAKRMITQTTPHNSPGYLSEIYTCSPDARFLLARASPGPSAISQLLIRIKTLFHY